MPESALALLTVPNLVLAAFVLLTLAGAAALLRSLLRWYLGLSAMAETLGRLEERVKYLHETLEEAVAEEEEEDEDSAPRGPALPKPGEEDKPRLPGPRG